MTVSIDIQANEIIETMPQGKLKYETEQALKKGFNNLHESIVYKLGGAVIEKAPAAPKTPAPLEITGWMRSGTIRSAKFLISRKFIIIN